MTSDPDPTMWDVLKAELEDTVQTERLRRRLRAAIVHHAADIDPDQHVERIAQEIERTQQ